jgi:tetratricopeptide (TPR) repeat protein
MSFTDEDTKPKSPFKTPPHGQPAVFIQPPADDEEPVRSGPGCFTWGIVGVLAFGVGLAIVLLAGAAGWTSGQRMAQDHATATQNAEINDQLVRIPGDIASGNTVLLDARIRFLATLTPGVPGVADLVQTATALYTLNRPTATPEVIATATLEAATPTTEPEIIVPQATGGAFDLAAMLQQARTAVSTAQYLDAIDLLDAIVAVDDTYERTEVRALMLEALSTQALRLFRSGSSLAEAIVLTDRAKEYGLSGDSDLHFEQYVAALYLTAKSAVGTNYPVAIQALQEVYNTAPNYLDVQQLLFDQIVAYGDAWVAQGEYCPAASQYQNALTMFNSPAVAGKRDAAATACAQGTPAPGSVPIDGGQPIAPIGVVETPTS